MDKNPRKEARRVFRSYGAQTAAPTKHGTNYLFPDGATVMIHDSDGHGTVAEKIRTVVARYGRITPRGLAGMAKVGNAPHLNLELLRASEHAKDRLGLMQSQRPVTFADVLHTLRLPERVMWSPRHESWVWIRELLAVAVCEVPGGHLIKTVMWSDNELFISHPRPEQL